MQLLIFRVRRAERRHKSVKGSTSTGGETHGLMTALQVSAGRSGIAPGRAGSTPRGGN